MPAGGNDIPKLRVEIVGMDFGDTGGKLRRFGDGQWRFVFPAAECGGFFSRMFGGYDSQAAPPMPIRHRTSAHAKKVTRSGDGDSVER